MLKSVVSTLAPEPAVSTEPLWTLDGRPFSAQAFSVQAFLLASAFLLAIVREPSAGAVRRSLIQRLCTGNRDRWVALGKPPCGCPSTFGFKNPAATPTTAASTPGPSPTHLTHLHVTTNEQMSSGSSSPFNLEAPSSQHKGWVLSGSEGPTLIKLQGAV